MYRPRKICFIKSALIQLFRDVFAQMNSSLCYETGRISIYPDHNGDCYFNTLATLSLGSISVASCGVSITILSVTFSNALMLFMVQQLGKHTSSQFMNRNAARGQRLANKEPLPCEYVLGSSANAQTSYCSLEYLSALESLRRLFIMITLHNTHHVGNWSLR